LAQNPFFMVCLISDWQVVPYIIFYDWWPVDRSRATDLSPAHHPTL
jgi:hypothetical protein